MHSETKKVLDKISPTFCIAKWCRTNLRTYEGTSYSCHHCRPTVTPVKDVKKDYTKLTNNDAVKKYRKQMLDGERPDECDHCWTREDQGLVSDRIIKSDVFIKLHDVEPKKLVKSLSSAPVHLDIAFDRTCNFKCAYCGPTNSSLWAEEIALHGNMEGIPAFSDRDTILNREQNPYNDAFWEWWEAGLKKSLRHLTITGGEPLLSKEFWKVLDKIEEDDLNITVMVNTNLCPPDKIFDKFLNRIKTFPKKNSIRVSTSIESTKERAEYSRYGLDYDKFMSNLHKVLQASSKVEVNLTNNALSFTSLTDIVKELTKFKLKYGADRVILHSNDVTYPEYLNLRMLPKVLRIEEENKFINFMKLNRKMFNENERYKFERTFELAMVEHPHIDYFRDQFLKFLDQYDERRNLSFNDTFPEIAVYRNNQI